MADISGKYTVSETQQLRGKSYADIVRTGNGRYTYTLYEICKVSGKGGGQRRRQIVTGTIHAVGAGGGYEYQDDPPGTASGVLATNNTPWGWQDGSSGYGGEMTPAWTDIPPCDDDG